MYNVQWLNIICSYNNDGRKYWLSTYLLQLVLLLRMTDMRCDVGKASSTPLFCHTKSCKWTIKRKWKKYILATILDQQNLISFLNGLPIKKMGNAIRSFLYLDIKSTKCVLFDFYRKLRSIYNFLYLKI